jgi:nucleotide-binding universal stress UspA family protein
MRRSDTMAQPLTAHLVVPVANEEDARATAISLAEYPHDRITVVHVIVKGGGSPDKLSLEQARELAQESFSAFREIIPDIETEIVYDEDVVEGVNDFAVSVDANAIAFRPRGGSRLIQLLAGDKALKLVTKTEPPVIALTDSDEEGN